MNLGEILHRTAARLPDKVALWEAATGYSRTYAELDAAADAFAAALEAWGVTPGDRVAIAIPNSLRFVDAYLGALRAGAVVVPLNVTLTSTELARILADAEARIAIAAPPALENVTSAADQVPSVKEVVSTETWDGFVGTARTPKHIAGSPDDLAVLSYTSGTTGAPKGAMLTHGNLVSNLEQQMAIPDDHVREEDVLLLSLPLFHIFGLNVPLGLLIFTGATGILVERFEPLDVLRLIEKHRVTVIFGAPTMYVSWVDTPGADQYDLSSVRIAVSGAASLPEETLRSFHALFGVKIYEGYGMTETAPTLTSNRMASEPRPASIGMPLPGVEMRLVDERGVDVELGDPGEILVRGPNVFKGYWKHEDENGSYFTEDGWFRTGDVAVRDEEGYLYLVDRKRDLIIVSGFNVFPSEVEAALLEDPGIEDAAVVGEPHPYTGETVKAFVVLSDGASLDEEGVLRNVQGRLARFKCPTKIEIVDRLPREPSGKVLRRALRS